MQLQVPDILGDTTSSDRAVDILFVGINPGLMSAFRGHHYAGPGNHFWPCMVGAGLVPDGYDYRRDVDCPQHGIGT